MSVIGMSGEKGGELKSLVKVSLQMPSNDTPRIQEGHILVGHIICELIELAFV
jgi:D-sedoheptulose 7-phosphate isomerase